MAQHVTILSINDETGNTLVLFEDDSNGVEFKTGIRIPEEHVSEEKILDFLARHWPYEEFVQRGKPPQNRHVEMKKIISVKKNITFRVQNPELIGQGP